MEFPVKTGAPAQSANRVRDLAGVRRRPAARCDEGIRPRGARRHHEARSQRRRSRAARRACTLVHRTQGTAAARWLLVGCGKRADFTAKRLTHGARRRRSTRCAAAAPRKRSSYLGYDTALAPAQTPRGHSVEAARASALPFRRAQEPHGPAGAARAPRHRLPDRHRARTKCAPASRSAPRSPNGSDLARDLGNRPPNVCTPSHLADAARDIAKRYRAHGGQGARRGRHAQARHGRAAVGDAGRATSRRD